MSRAGHDPGHIPVMLAEVLEALNPADAEIYVDGTFGGGGYTRSFLAAAECRVLGIDRDPAAISRGQDLAAGYGSTPDGLPRLTMLHGTFGSMDELVRGTGLSSVSGIVLDLGVSSFQIDEADRGFSFRADGPLDMRMGSEGESAADLVNAASEKELADIFHFYGEERHARRVAKAVVSARADEPFRTTLRLAELIRSVVPADRSGIDSATRSFQGLRIAVNDELGEIERGLDAAFDLIAPGGRIVVVSFHSLEDRIVKRAFAKAAGTAPTPSRHNPGAFSAPPLAPFTLLSRRAVRPSEEECARNPRARSARLRALLRHTDPAARTQGNSTFSRQETDR
ncbi:16S rRNA (cytosine(1402)-N(4))-methyltransferase RsmH [Acetobacter sp. AN02]|uniref:16S rRNA (cytosine(1402)-N(4))-methyltransferase RsmH n=1 Tax=Acetobacter sp. AN02 TaxID=2894186 RepID=UPI002434632E|nr:16S rRNA (cytosine(1402)-N(4))-methyltransferase RsmH [Acetobacter sp. AN02]MDG6094207.1 16S rRNA (cytosine(1402)-N(4))-methyltransferase RsmH [Acetobacter sp. AN02]